MSESILILVPTDFELGKLHPHLQNLDHESVEVSVCGFGPIAAAARTATLIEKHQPKAVLIAGIAGSLNNALPVGEATIFSDVSIDGIGAGSGDGFESAEEMGWDFWGSIGSKLELNGATKDVSLLTVCAGSGSAEQASSRCERFPGAMAEDMETFAAAFAAQAVGVPLTAIRGISNVAGQRDKQHWRIDEALSAAAELVNIWIEEALEQ